MWYVYMVKCVDNTFYCGCTNDLKRRVEEHNSENSETKYTRTRRPVTLVYSIPVKNRSAALVLEMKIKKANRIEKVKMIHKHNEFLRRQKKG